MPSPSPRALSSIALLAALALAACGGRGSRERDTAPDPDVLTAEEIERTPSPSVERSMAGRWPGVHVTESAGGISVRIRGATSITASTEPLYVIDGVVIEAGPGGSLTGIALRDIASIQVLKDAAATSMYGMRGANGVIVIRTKRPQ